MADRAFEVQYSPSEGITLRIHPMRLRLLPEETWGHLRTANKEMLLALRSFIDSCVASVEKAEEAKSKPRSRIKVG